MTPADTYDQYVRARRRLYETKSIAHPEFVTAVAAYKTAIEAAREVGYTEAQLRAVEALEPASTIIPEPVVLH